MSIPQQGDEKDLKIKELEGQIEELEEKLRIKKRNSIASLGISAMIYPILALILYLIFQPCLS